MKQIRVLHISETFVTGVYTYIKAICEFTSMNPQIKTTIIYSPNRKGTLDQDFDNDFDKSIKLIPLSMQREINVKADLESLKKLKSLIKNIEPDVIHLHSSKAGVLGRIAAKAYPKARVYYTPNGYSFLREDISQKKRLLFKSIEKYIAKLYGGTTIACGETEFLYAKKIGKATMVRNGISLSELSSLGARPTTYLNSIVTLGRISAQKNPQLFNKIAEHFPEINFIWIGDGELRQQLISKNIQITGWMDRPEALKELSKYDVYLQTSLWEGLPFTIIEAMTLQKPILATNVIGNKDAVVHNMNGFLCHTLEDFKISINTLAKQPELLKQFSLESLDIAESKFDRNKNFKKLMRIYFNQEN